MKQKEKDNSDMQKIDSTTSSFESFITRECVYVDKTMYLYKLLTSGSRYFFLSRPRRFGKSLTLSTLKAIFEGRKELFDGLYIGQTDYEFKKHPVIHIDFATLELRNADLLEETLLWQLLSIADKYNISIENKNQMKPVFKELLGKLYEQHGPVVVLIDEYDKPLSDSIDNVQRAVEIRDVLRGFYEVIKSSASYLRFVFITGVTKYSKMSIFSSMNNLNDISIDSRYSTMLGYTQEELEHYFDEGIDEGSKALNLTRSEYLSKIKRTYDGYCFAPNSQTVYNPVSVGRFFDEGGEIFRPYWMDTGGQKLLYETAKKVNFDIEQDILKHFSLIRLFREDIVEVVTGDITKEKYNSLLLQTGYLTIINSNKTGDLVDLGFPNYEVKTAFSEIVMPLYSKDESIFVKESLLDYLNKGDWDGFVTELKSDFARIPYHLLTDFEKSYHQAFYCMMLSLGAKIEAEVATNKGRIDATVETDKYIYIFEFKINQSAAKAIAQIRENGYAERYTEQRRKGKKVYLVGVSFSLKKRSIGSIKLEDL